MAKSQAAKGKKQMKGSKERRRMQITDLPGEEKDLSTDEQKKVRGGLAALMEATQKVTSAPAMLPEATQIGSRKPGQ